MPVQGGCGGEITSAGRISFYVIDWFVAIGLGLMAAPVLARVAGRHAIHLLPLAAVLPLLLGLYQDALCLFVGQAIGLWIWLKLFDGRLLAKQEAAPV